MVLGDINIDVTTEISKTINSWLNYVFNVEWKDLLDVSKVYALLFSIKRMWKSIKAFFVVIKNMTNFCEYKHYHQFLLIIGITYITWGLVYPYIRIHKPLENERNN